jgi:hypothetical protein
MKISQKPLNLSELLQELIRADRMEEVHFQISSRFIISVGRVE